MENRISCKRTIYNQSIHDDDDDDCLGYNILVNICKTCLISIGVIGDVKLIFNFCRLNKIISIISKISPFNK